MIYVSCIFFSSSYSVLDLCKLKQNTYQSRPMIGVVDDKCYPLYKGLHKHSFHHWSSLCDTPRFQEEWNKDHDIIARNCATYCKTSGNEDILLLLSQPNSG